MQTYGGGLKCCAHTFFLTDLDQDSLILVERDVYFLKWLYYQEYIPASAHNPAASHKQLFTGCF